MREVYTNLEGFTLIKFGCSAYVFDKRVSEDDIAIVVDERKLHFDEYFEEENTTCYIAEGNSIVGEEE